VDEIVGKAPIEGMTEEWAHAVAELGGKPVRPRRSKP
jgi:hypothetical protein